MNYTSTIETIKKEFRKVPNIYGILLYGSAAILYMQKSVNKPQKDPKDIDLILVFDFPFVIPRDAYERSAETTKRLKELLDIRLDLSVCDRELPRTRFITWGPLTVNIHFHDSSCTILGKDVRQLFSGTYFIDADRFPITEEQFARIRNESEVRGYMAWNLHGIRKRAIDYKYNAKYYRQAFDLTPEIAIGSMTNFLRNAVFLKNGNWYNEEEKILEATKEEFRLSVLEIEMDEDKLETLDFNSRVNALFDSLRIREEIVQALCKNNKTIIN